MLTAGKSDRFLSAGQLSGKRRDGTTDEKGGTAEIKPSPLAGAEVFLFLPCLFIPIDENTGKVHIRVIRKRV